MRLHIKKEKFVVGALAATAVLGAAGLLYASSGEHHSTKSVMEASLSPEKLKDLGLRVMNFAALVIILVKFLKKPLADALRGRREAIVEQIDGLNTRKADVEQSYQQCEEKLSKVDEQVSSIIENAKAQAESVKERIIEDATRAAGDMKRKAELSIQFELSEARARLQAEVADQATLMAKEMIKNNLQESDHNAIVEGYLEKVGAIQ